MRGSVLLVLVGCLVSGSLHAQSQAEPPEDASGSAYALSVRSRLIVEDVTVLDRQGKPIFGLPRSAFHVVDENKPQTISDFTQSNVASAEVTRGTAPGVATNLTLLRNQGTLVAVLIDPMSIDLPDQMYLRLQALRFLEVAPANIKIAVFRANNQGVPVLLQGPTTDRALLRAAVTSAVPVMQRAEADRLQDAVTELGNLADFLRAAPGRKAVLWLAGQFPLYQDPRESTFCGGFGSMGPDCNSASHQRLLESEKQAFEALEEARVAVYPIDVRGVLQGGLNAVRIIHPEDDPANSAKSPTSESSKIAGQYNEMDRLADATGGSAFYSQNSVTTMMSTAVSLASASYTLSYRPSDAAVDGRWHKIRITVDGPYSVRYRSGYYAAAIPAPKPAQRRVLNASSGTKPASGQPQGPGLATLAETHASAPIPFSVRFLQAGREDKGTEVKLRYLIASDQLAFDTSHGHAHFRLVALAYNAWGDVLGQNMDLVDTHYTPDQMKLAARIGTPADQTVTVAKGAQYLLLAVEDLRTERVGTVQISLAQVREATAAPRP